MKKCKKSNPMSKVEQILPAGSGRVDDPWEEGLEEEKEHRRCNCPSETEIAQAYTSSSQPSVGEEPPFGLLIVEPPTAIPPCSTSLQSRTFTAASLHYCFFLLHNQIFFFFTTKYLFFLFTTKYHFQWMFTEIFCLLKAVRYSQKHVFMARKFHLTSRRYFLSFEKWLKSESQVLLAAKPAFAAASLL